MKILIIGGTLFLGRHLVELASAEGHRLTLFNRGRSNPGLFPEIERIEGDRDGGLDLLRGRRWDAVVDTCGYLPRLVRDSARLLADSVGRYLFVSTLSVLADPDRPGLDESAARARLDEPDTEEITGPSYGGLKALCEAAVEEELPGRALNIRPGLIVGPHDPSDRFTWWVWRVARGGEMLAPGEPGAPVQIIDARDLARFMLDCLIQERRGIYHATGPVEPTTMGAVLDSCRLAPASDARFEWVDNDFLIEQDVKPYTELPLWVAGSAGFNAVSIERALAAGLRTRALAETITDTAAWLGDRGELRAGLSADREHELLRLWRTRA